MIDKLIETSYQESGDFYIGSVCEFSPKKFAQLLVNELCRELELLKDSKPELCLTDYECGLNKGLEKAIEYARNFCVDRSS